MKLEINDKLIKTIEKRCMSYLAPGEVLEVYGVSVDFIDGTWYTFQLGWGHTGFDKAWYNDEITFDDKDASIDFICGMIAQLVYMTDRGEEDEN